MMLGLIFQKKWNENDGEPLYDVWPTTANLPIQFWYNANDSLQFQFDDPYYATTDSIITSEPILTQVDETYTIQVVGNDNLETAGWYYSINGAAFNFTTDNIQTRSFTTNQTMNVIVQGTGGYEFTSSIDLVIPPADPVVEPVERLVATGGNYEDFDYLYFETTLEGRYLYGLVSKGKTNRLNGLDVWDIEYDPRDGKFYDVGSNNPFQWGKDNTGTNLSAFPTATNLQTHYFYKEDDSLNFQFNNPYYVAPDEPVVEPVARIEATGGVFNGTHDYMYDETTPEGRFLNVLVTKDLSY